MVLLELLSLLYIYIVLAQFKAGPFKGCVNGRVCNLAVMIKGIKLSLYCIITDTGQCRCRKVFQREVIRTD